LEKRIRKKPQRKYYGEKEETERANAWQAEVVTDKKGLLKRAESRKSGGKVIPIKGRRPCH